MFYSFFSQKANYILHWDIYDNKIAENRNDNFTPISNSHSFLSLHKIFYLCEKQKNMKYIVLLIASAALLYSCDENKSSTPVAETTEAVQVDGAETATVAENVESSPATATTQNPETTNPSAERPALNPPHGQPFHRCEIPVGAPIDSQPGQNPAQQAQPQQGLEMFNISPSEKPAQATGPKPTLNPAHGQPHHRCDIKVGDPLI